VIVTLWAWIFNTVMRLPSAVGTRTRLTSGTPVIAIDDPLRSADGCVKTVLPEFGSASRGSDASSVGCSAGATGSVPSVVGVAVGSEPVSTGTVGSGTGTVGTTVGSIVGTGVGVPVPPQLIMSGMHNDVTPGARAPALVLSARSTTPAMASRRVKRD
jgi:hypothetical protein